MRATAALGEGQLDAAYPMSASCPAPVHGASQRPRHESPITYSPPSPGSELIRITTEPLHGTAAACSENYRNRYATRGCLRSGRGERCLNRAPFGKPASPALSRQGISRKRSQLWSRRSQTMVQTPKSWRSTTLSANSKFRLGWSIGDSNPGPLACQARAEAHFPYSSGRFRDRAASFLCRPGTRHVGVIECLLSTASGHWARALIRHALVQG
jgi:hypothetical protein